METLIDILRRARFAWAGVCICALFAGVYGACANPVTPALQIVIALGFTLMAWAPLYFSIVLPARLAMAVLGTAMLPFAVVFAFDPANMFLYGAPYVFGIGMAAAIGIYLISFILGPLFRRA